MTDDRTRLGAAGTPGPQTPGPETGKRGAARWLKLLLGCGVTAAFAWLLLRGLDLAEVGAAFGRLSLPVVAAALAFLAVGYFLRIVRWWRMLRVLEPGLPLKPCAWPFLASIAANNVLPFRAGDALRIFGFRRQLRSPAMRVAGTLVVERLLDLVVLAGFFFVGLIAAPEGAFPREFVVAVTWLGGLGAAALAGVALFPGLLDRLRGFLLSRGACGGAGGWRGAVSRHGAQLAEALGLARTPARLLGLVGLSAAAWACEGAVFATVAAAVQADAAPLAPWLSLATGTLATLLPSAPGYVGTFDWFAAQGLAAYGASPETAAAFALTVHAVLWTPLTACGAVYLILRGSRRQKRGPGHSAGAPGGASP